ncbi:lamin tail domain-containing protein [Sediminibacillus albus]|uniref:3',5'-cyclic AMP phosphodiesterase CpdA n=1 Tax=Sediminibacillus albus TaxID=407036 RepID=A0A1G8YAQ8_9BACI|nr:lamin tail domain-containing protein [Sediminibacillus albus]SDJ99325.1 3',5'-cyclic AMP phosphodiesterase CpdA [Sediminibacillus albus]
MRKRTVQKRIRQFVSIFVIMAVLFVDLAAITPSRMTVSAASGSPAAAKEEEASLDEGTLDQQQDQPEAKQEIKDSDSGEIASKVQEETTASPEQSANEETSSASVSTENPEDSPTSNQDDTSTKQQEAPSDKHPSNEEKTKDNQSPQNEGKAIDFNSLPPLLITEINPSNEGYDYFEVHNNSNQPFVLDYLKISLHSNAGKQESAYLQFSPAIIKPDQTIIFWSNDKKHDLKDFNKHYQVNVPEEAVVEYTGPAFTDGNIISIENPNGEKIVSAAYTAEDRLQGQAIHYQHPSSGTEMERYGSDSRTTPVQLEDVQIPEQPVALPPTTAPTINHEHLEEIVAGKSVQVEAAIETDGESVSAELYYQTTDQEDYQVIEMQPTKNGSFLAEIPAQQLKGEQITYYMTAATAHYRITYPAETPLEAAVIKPEKEKRVLAASQSTEIEDFDAYPHLLITELSPNSQGGGTDYYEYFELYNNTDQPLSMANYRFIYYYTDSGNEVPFQVPENTVINPQETLVFWYNKGNKQLDAFNENFGVQLSEEQIIEVTDPNFPGFANSGNRALVLTDNQGQQLIDADYLGEDNDNTGAVIQYQYPKEGTTMEKYLTMANPTPGIIEAVQVPVEPVHLPEPEDDVTAPVIDHTPVSQAKAFSSITIEAAITDDKAVPTATVFVKAEDASAYTTLAMTADAANPASYSAEIPGVYVSSNISYYVEASDGVHTVRTEEAIIEVDKQEVDPEKIPSLLVTEVVPDSTNTGSADGYEFIEIYNNTNQAINFQDYKLQYRYGTDPESDIIWPSVPDNVVIPSQETLVFWIINGENGEQTVADFNENYGTNLVENEDIVRIYSAGMANGSMRGLIAATNAGQELAIAYYNDQEGIDDTQPDKGIVYKYPTDSSSLMEKVSAGSIAATPGSVEAYQVPDSQVSVPEDNIPPTIENLTEAAEVNQTEDINLTADIQDNIEVKTVQVYYRANGQEDYQSALLQEDYDDMLYHHRIYSPEIIAKDYVEYYFTASDGTNQVTSETYRVQVTNELDDSSLRLNVQEGDILSGEKIIKATSRDEGPEAVKLLIDDTEVSGEAPRAVEHTAYFAFEVSGVNTYFQNGVTIGDEIIHIFDDWIAQWQTITVPVSADQLQVGENTITIRAGNKATPWEGDPGENRDDYNLRNVRLVLSDGTILTDPSHGDASEVFDMGDDGTVRVFEDFTFTIEDGLAQSKAYVWQTDSTLDGLHTIRASDSDEELETDVYVDNTAPVIQTNVEEGKQYKGAFDIDVTVSDEIAGTEAHTVWLDGEKIEVPYAASSGLLTAGSHELRIEAVDTVGNQSEELVEFSVVDEHPDNPVNQSPQSELAQPLSGDPVLRVEVNDPTGDTMDVGFYQAHQYTPDNLDHVASFSNAADVEPPASPAPAGETGFGKQDIDLASEKDGKYMITDSTGQFPYHRFDVTVDEGVDESDLVELVWNGNSFAGRKVTMYAWNHTEAKWESIDAHIAGQEDFELKGTVPVGDYVQNSKVNVIVQDEIPSSSEEYDYTFVWMSDTQYYSESYPYIYDRQTQWIVDNRDAMNIQYVMHTGDLVDESDKAYQWDHADNYMKTLDDAGVPYGVLAGNHDVSQKTNDYTNYYKYFGADRFQEKPYYGGSYLNNRGHYDLISANGNDYIMVYLGWGVEEEGIAWMNEVLAAYPDRQAILNFHEYLQATGTRHPLGEKLYNEVVVPNENVIAVLSGHYHEAQLLVDELDDDGDGTSDRTVYQMLADYQAGPEGGQGYMRLLHFDSDNNKIIVNTYSPYLDDYNYYDTDAYPGKDEFTLDLDLAAKEKRVATDYFAVNVYTDDEIGRVEDVPSGETAEIVWTGLEEGKIYSWYATVSDQYTGETRSDIWTFVKGEDQDPNQSEPPKDEEDPPGEPNQPGGEKPAPPSGGGGDLDGEEKPTKPEQPGKQPGDLNGGNDPTNKQPGQNKDQDGDQDKITGGKLADTATNMFTLILTGILLLGAGASLFVYRLRKRRIA